MKQELDETLSHPPQPI